mmetsp:Transcript_12385/g.12790  ORF Transcript_12385/g.12790 Transcript_12385/m.12790 type:complete len:565 (-) Transcript_12385:261-1955(-)
MGCNSSTSLPSNNNNNNNKTKKNKYKNISSSSSSILNNITYDDGISQNITINEPLKTLERHDFNDFTYVQTGGAGKVFLASRKNDNKKYAMKFFGYTSKQPKLNDIEREITLMQALKGIPNVVQIEGKFMDSKEGYVPNRISDQPYPVIVMEALEGGDLFERIQLPDDIMTERFLASAFRGVIEALHHMHQRCLIHRDLKLENFLFEGDSASSPLIMIDFGLSKHFDPHERMNQRVGSCYYTAPEVLSGDYDYRCDIWSLGVICYMLLSGSPPFYGKTPEDIHHATLTKEAEFPERRFRHVSLMGLDFMRRLLTKNPNHRISTEEALAHPFITTHCANPPEGVPVISSHHILNSFRVFANLNLVLKIILQLVAYTLPPEQLSPFRYEFQQVDTNHDGVVQLSELLALGSPEESPEIEELYYQLFITHSRSFQERVSEPTLSYSEYLAAAICHRIEVSPERVLIAFDLLDIDSEGCITPASIISYFGEDIDQNTLKHEILELKSYYEPTNGHSYLPSDGIGKSILLEAWNQARLSSCIPPPPPYGSFVRNNSDSSLNSAMEQCSS